MADVAELPFAQRFAKLLFERHPEWRSYTTKPDWRWQADTDLCVRVPSRHAPHCPLCVDTAGDEIIVSWAGWHAHCDSVDWGSEDEYVGEAFRLLDGIQNDQLVVIVDWTPNGPGGTGALVRAEEVEAKLASHLWLRAAELWPICVASWSGALDRGPFDPTKC